LKRFENRPFPVIEGIAKICQIHNPSHSIWRSADAARWPAAQGCVF
jgi:hypothetical protein